MDASATKVAQVIKNATSDGERQTARPILR